MEAIFRKEIKLIEDSKMLSETLGFKKGLAPGADRFETGPSTDVFSLANAEALTFLVYHQGGTTGKATLTVEACDNVTPSNTEAIPFRYRRTATGASDNVGAINLATAAGIDTVAAEDTLIEIEIKASELPANKRFARLTTAEVVDDPVNACIIGILSGLRYAGVSQPSALA